MSELKAVHHLALMVNDLDRAERFYGDILGLPVIERWKDDAGAPRSIWFSLGTEAFLAVERASQMEPRRIDTAPGWHCVALSIDVATREQWRKRFVDQSVVIDKESIYSIYVRDPEGNLVSLSHYPHKTNQPTST